MHVHVDIEKKNVLIIGWPAAGKTYLSKLLAHDNPKHFVIHTDDFIEYGYKESLYKILELLPRINNPTIIEGMQGYRLLRKGIELNCYYPDIVIELEISEALMYRTYKNERANKDATALKGFINTHKKILSDYKNMVNKHPPQWHKIVNNY